ncbi:MAG: TlpA disulfide reductase family protein, partial [Pedobacter sp.]|nr:TlpA disulfide reductase family protein [Pedobacter sp.]
MNRFLMLLLLMGASFLTYGQSSDIKKPEYVIIAGNEIITKEQATNLGKEGYVKAMQKGVTSEERAALVEKFGEKIGDKEFIVLLTIFTEEERQANQKKKNVTAPKNDVTSYDHEYLLKINDLAVDFTVKMLDGKKVKLSSLKGKVVLINFWATWCA